MKIAVFGTGEVGTAIATKLKSLDHDVAYGSRHPGKDKDGIPVLSHEDAAEHGEWVVNALHGEDALEILPTLPLAGKLLIDIGNYRSAVDGPIEQPLGEALQAALPDTRLVKTLNFVSAQLMGEPQRLAGTHTVLIAGNDAEARAEVTALLEKFGWQDIIDLGDLGASRPMEQLAPMWIHLNKKFGHVYFNFAVLRDADAGQKAE